MKSLWTTTVMLLLPAVAVHAQDRDRYRVSGQVSAGLQQLDNDTDSSKIEEYRDLRDGPWSPGLRLDVYDTASGRFLEAVGADVPRDDKSLWLRAGGPGTWRLDASWAGIPHLLSNKARSPFTDRGRGLLEAPATIPITFKKLATAAGDTAGVLGSDALAAAYAASVARPVDLGTQRDRATIALRYDAIEAIKLRLGYGTQSKEGSQVGYGPIGDRPPRTLNVQLAEPVDWRTQDLRAEAEYLGQRYQAQVSYERSDFANSIDTLTWRNVFATPAPGAAFDVWDRQVAAYGRRPLAPDNQYQNVTVTLGADLPAESHLTATAAYGRMEQDQTLLPYAFQSGSLAVQTLPRATAEGRIDSVNLRADYTISPVRRLNVRASYSRYGLDNQTPESRFLYVTQDTSNLNGTSSFKNKRVSLAYAYTRQDAGLDATYRLGFWGGSLGLAYQREQVDREYREADTTEDRLRATFRARPASWLSLRAAYLYGVRDGGTYDGFVTRQGYWYAPAEAGTDADNPAFAFSNHPDMRRFDVSDRHRQQVDVSATLIRAAFSASASVRRFRDDFGSDVRSSQPLLGLAVADQGAWTPGDQLGRLEDERLRYGLDLVYAPGGRWTVNVFGNMETADGGSAASSSTRTTRPTPAPSRPRSLARGPGPPASGLPTSGRARVPSASAGRSRWCPKSSPWPPATPSPAAASRSSTPASASRASTACRSRTTTSSGSGPLRSSGTTAT